MESSMRPELLDVVALTEDIPEHGLKHGQAGGRRRDAAA